MKFRNHFVALLYCTKKTYACNTYAFEPNLENVFFKIQTHQTKDEMHKSNTHSIKIV